MNAAQHALVFWLAWERKRRWGVGVGGGRWGRREKEGRGEKRWRSRERGIRGKERGGEWLISILMQAKPKCRLEAILI